MEFIKKAFLVGSTILSTLMGVCKFIKLYFND